MKELIIASSNSHKISEIRDLLPQDIHVKSLTDIGFYDEIEENGNTFNENAQIKAQFISEKYKIPCLADDSGLVVNSLNGEPGIFSARYAGEPKDNQKNINLLLKNLQSKADTSAYFTTVICYFENGKPYFFEGKIDGKIIFEQRGKKGFGYDPIFIPNDYEKTFAEMSKEEKNKISHRHLALEKFINFYTKKN